MRPSRLGSVLVWIVLLPMLSSGCLVLNQYNPAEVLVRDAETKKPIPAAQVRISYPISRYSFAPHESTGTTDAEGIAHLEIASSEDSCILLNAAAAGYMSKPEDISAEAYRQIEPPSRNSAGNSPNASRSISASSARSRIASGSRSVETVLCSSSSK